MHASILKVTLTSSTVASVAKLLMTAADEEEIKRQNADQKNLDEVCVLPIAATVLH
jgi:hypothetical protein